MINNLPSVYEVIVGKKEPQEVSSVASNSKSRVCMKFYNWLLAITVSLWNGG